MSIAGRLVLSLFGNSDWAVVVIFDRFCFFLLDYQHDKPGSLAVDEKPCSWDLVARNTIRLKQV